MLAGYFDDAGTHYGSEIVAVAGYFAPPREWERFEAKWNALLAAEGISFYHSVECAHGKGQFAEWPEARRNRVHREAVEVITGSDIIPLGISVDGPRFRASHGHLAPDRPIEKLAFYYCLGTLLRRLGQRIRQAKEDPAAVVVEDSPKTLGDALKVYEMAVGRHPGLAASFEGPPRLRPKLGYPQLQAADVLAYEMGLDLKRFYASDRKHQTRKSFSALVEHSQRVGGLLMHQRDVEQPRLEGQ